MTITEIRKEAKKYGIEIGKLTTEKDSQGEYTVYENGRCTYFQVWAEGVNAAEAKRLYAQDKLYSEMPDPFAEQA